MPIAKLALAVAGLASTALASSQMFVVNGYPDTENDAVFTYTRDSGDSPSTIKSGVEYNEITYGGRVSEDTYSAFTGALEDDSLTDDVSSVTISDDNSPYFLIFQPEDTLVQAATVLRAVPTTWADDLTLDSNATVIMFHTVQAATYDVQTGACDTETGVWGAAMAQESYSTEAAVFDDNHFASVPADTYTLRWCSGDTEVASVTQSMSSNGVYVAMLTGESGDFTAQVIKTTSLTSGVGAAGPSVALMAAAMALVMRWQL